MINFSLSLAEAIRVELALLRRALDLGPTDQNEADCCLNLANVVRDSIKEAEGAKSPPQPKE